MFADSQGEVCVWGGIKLPRLKREDVPVLKKIK